MWSNYMFKSKFYHACRYLCELTSRQIFQKTQVSAYILYNYSIYFLTLQLTDINYVILGITLAIWCIIGAAKFYVTDNEKSPKLNSFNGYHSIIMTS